MPDVYSCEVCGKPTSRRGRKGNDYAWLCPEHMPRQCVAYAGRGRQGISPCIVPATRERDGKWYCAIRDPIAVAERNKKRDEKYRAESDARSERWRTLDRHQRIGELMEQLATMGGMVTLYGDGSTRVQVRFAHDGVETDGIALVDVLESALENEAENV